MECTRLCTGSSSASKQRYHHQQGLSAKNSLDDPLSCNPVLHCSHTCLVLLGALVVIACILLKWQHLLDLLCFQDVSWDQPEAIRSKYFGTQLWFCNSSICNRRQIVSGKLRILRRTRSLDTLNRTANLISSLRTSAGMNFIW